MKRLFEKMQVYQTDCLLADPDAQLPEGTIMMSQVYKGYI